MTPTLRLLSLCLLISLLSAPLRGIDRDRRLDELYHTSWTAKDGAPSEIFAIAQTTDGYLWLGTTTGLVRFDGIHFENYESPSGQAFPARNASSLLAIPDGGLWIGFSSGEVSLLRNGRITSYSRKDGLPPSTVRSLVRDRQSRIWAASVTGLSLFDGSRWRPAGADWNFSGGATAAEGRPGHYGIPGIRERAKQIGGKFDIWSGAGAGTEIDLSVAGSITYRTSRGRSLFRLFHKKAG